MSIFVPTWRNVDYDLFTRIVTDTYQEPGTQWAFTVGDPESWHFQDRLLVPEGELLDLGIGHGRSSMSYALRGMNVTGLDKNADSLSFLSDVAIDFDLPFILKVADLQTEEFGHERYDTILCIDVFVHFPSRIAAYAVLDRAILALKSGGYLFIRAVGKEDSRYEWLRESHGMIIDEDVVQAWCSCSGERTIEDHLFFHQTELLQYFLSQGLTVCYSRVLPEYGRMNVMFGSDWHSGQHDETRNGMITLIVQKP